MKETIEAKSVLRIKTFFNEHNGVFEYKNQRGNVVICKAFEDGLIVDCLGGTKLKSFLPWGVFWHAVNVMLENGGIAARGEAVSAKLGDADLPFNSVEGRIAHTVYGKKLNDSVFRRISPVARILIECGVCINKRGDLELA